jgi:hypothetical protein
MSTSAGLPPTPSSVGGGADDGCAALPASTPLPGAATPLPCVGARPAAPPLSWGDVLLWKDPVSTVLIFAAGAAAYAAACWAFSGATPVSPTSAAAYALLAHLGVNFVRFFCSARWHASCMWEGSSWTDAAVERAAVAVRRGAALHDAYLSAKDPHVTLGVRLGRRQGTGWRPGEGRGVRRSRLRCCRALTGPCPTAPSLYAPRRSR